MAILRCPAGSKDRRKLQYLQPLLHRKRSGNNSFTNDRYPHAKNADWKIERTLVKKGASIGAGSTILCGVTIGEKAMIGIGSVVTKDVPAGEVWVGNPAHFLKKVDEYIN